MTDKSYVTELFTNHIKQWISYDNKIQNLKNEIKQLNNEKNKTGDYITEYIETNNLIKTKINLSNGYLKYSKINQTSPLTFKYISKCLKEYFQDEDLANNVCNFIKNNRTFVSAVSIKRYTK